MSFARALTVEWEDISCAACGMVFWVPAHWDKSRREDKKGFVCPNGHSLSYNATELDRLKKQLEQEKAATEAQRQRADREERRRVAMAGQVTRIKNRVANGVCPCCNRTFQNLAAHMAGQHPDWKAQEIGDGA